MVFSSICDPRSICSFIFFFSLFFSHSRTLFPRSPFSNIIVRHFNNERYLRTPYLCSEYIFFFLWVYSEKSYKGLFLFYTNGRGQIISFTTKIAAPVRWTSKRIFRVCFGACKITRIY